MFSAPSQYRQHKRQQTEVLLCLAHPAATAGIETILTWLGLDVTRASSLPDLRAKSAWGDVAFIVSQSNIICHIPDNTALPVIDVEDFLFHQMIGKESGGTSRRFDAAAFIDRILSLAELTGTQRSTAKRRQHASLGYLSHEYSGQSAEW